MGASVREEGCAWQKGEGEARKGEVEEGGGGGGGMMRGKVLEVGGIFVRRRGEND